MSFIRFSEWTNISLCLKNEKKKDTSLLKQAYPLKIRWELKKKKYVGLKIKSMVSLKSNCECVKINDRQ